MMADTGGDSDVRDRRVVVMADRGGGSDGR